ncbi:hypothetical protein AB0F64_27775 [Streptomyces sp. NPDC026294]|uniref:hypothetical protein n=1 Tax=Streptomyces sp. NPDC026294 TaxID=3155362 RepID=UPI0033FA91FC
MADRQNPDRAFDTAMTGRAAVWKSIEAFAHAWTRPLTLADGIPSPEVRKAEERLGLRLPAALSEACGWGVPLEQVAHDDPPVSLFSDRLPDGSRTPYLDRVSSACTEPVLSETVMARRYGPYGRECPATAAVIRAAEAICTPVALPPCPAWYHPAGDPVRWYSAPGKLLCREPDADESVPHGSVLVVVGRSEADAREVVAAVPGERSRFPAGENAGGGKGRELADQHQ